MFLLNQNNVYIMLSYCTSFSLYFRFAPVCYGVSVALLVIFGCIVSYTIQF